MATLGVSKIGKIATSVLSFFKSDEAKLLIDAAAHAAEVAAAKAEAEKHEAAADVAAAEAKRLLDSAQDSSQTLSADDSDAEFAAKFNAAHAHKGKGAK